ncbi:MAG: hypothetical protein WBE85_10990 [Methylocella sp.]
MTQTHVALEGVAAKEETEKWVKRNEGAIAIILGKASTAISSLRLSLTYLKAQTTIRSLSVRFSGRRSANQVPIIS